MNLKRHPIYSLSAAIIVLTVATCLAHAQDTPAPPSPPYVGALTGDFNLTKKFTYTATGSLTPEQKAIQGDPTNPVEVDMVKKGAIRRDTEHFLDGTGRIIWRVQAYRFIVDAQHPDSVNMDMVVPVTNPKDTAPHYQDPTDFPELSWITDSSYSGVQNQQGKPCYIFKVGDQTVYVDASTRLPIFFQSKTVQVTYTYSDPPSDPLQLPAGYVQKLAKFQRALRGQF